MSDKNGKPLSVEISSIFTNPENDVGHLCHLLIMYFEFVNNNVTLKTAINV